MADCIHGLDERWCATCLHGCEQQDEQLHPGVMSTARYAGSCRRCGDPIAPGEAIRMMSGADRTEWWHAGCAEEDA